MATFYGQVDGMSSTSASRRGSANSGLKTSAQSWQGSVIVNLRLDENDKLKIRIDLANDSRSCMADTYFFGTMEELKDAFDLASDVRNGKVSIVRHRKNV